MQSKVNATQYEGRRLTLSYPAIEKIRHFYGLPDNVTSHALAGYVERVIFESLCDDRLKITSK